MPSLTEDFVKEIERRILTGQWPLRMRIPTSRELAEEFMVSRSVINAGISELCNNGYLQTVPRKYICVSNWKETGGFALLRGMMDNGLWDVQFFDDIFESRMNTGKATAIKAAAARTEEDLIRLRSAIDREKTCRTAQEKAIADREFHSAIAAASHNIIYTIMHNNFTSLADSLALEFYEKLDNYDFIIDLHEKIYEAIRARNVAEAERNIILLLSHGENELRKWRENLYPKDQLPSQEAPQYTL